MVEFKIKPPVTYVTAGIKDKALVVVKLVKCIFRRSLRGDVLRRDALDLFLLKNARKTRKFLIVTAAKINTS